MGASSFISIYLFITCMSKAVNNLFKHADTHILLTTSCVAVSFSFNLFLRVCRSLCLVYGACMNIGHATVATGLI